MSMFYNYTKERAVKDIVENDMGFATFVFNGAECYIEDIYVVPEHRCKGAASKLADIIASVAKDRGCKYLTGSVVPSAKGSTESLKVLLAYGFKLLKSEPNIIYFVKEL